MTSGWARVAVLLPDELFSSWLARAALDVGCDPLVLTGEIWPRWRVWTVDPDRGIPDERLHTLSSDCGISAEALRAAMLRPIASTVAGGLPTGTIWPWMLAQGSRNRRRHGGLQYCPGCLSEDSRPHYRVQWRLAWHTACARHGRWLVDRCPHCAAPIEPHRLEAEDEHLALCANCKGDLRHTNPLEAIASALAFQKAADRMAHDDGERATALAPAKWFGTARAFTTLLREAKRHPQGRLAGAFHDLGVDLGNQPAPATGLRFELLPVEERAALLDQVSRVMGPNAAASLLILKGSRRPPPAHAGRATEASGSKPLATAPKASRSPRLRSAVLGDWARLRRRHGLPEH